jgi:Flp pilus assembly protein TadG
MSYQDGKIGIDQASRCLAARASIRCARSSGSPERGQSMVEMALLLPLFLVFIFGIIEIGRAWWVKHVLVNAAREGARVLVLPSGPGYPYATQDDVNEAARQAAKEYLAFAGLNDVAQIQVIDVNVTGPGNATIRKVGINITYPFDTPLPALLLSGSSPINMGVTSVMEHE